MSSVNHQWIHQWIIDEQCHRWLSLMIWLQMHFYLALALMIHWWFINVHWLSLMICRDFLWSLMTVHKQHKYGNFIDDFRHNLSAYLFLSHGSFHNNGLPSMWKSGCFLMINRRSRRPCSCTTVDSRMPFILSRLYRLPNTPSKQ